MEAGNVKRALLAMFYGRVIRGAEPCNYGVANVMSKVTQVDLCSVCCSGDTL